MSFQTKRSANNLYSFYKIYYINKLIKTIQIGYLAKQNKIETTFIFYGTINTFSHTKRIAFINQFNNLHNIKIKFSFIPYSNFKILIIFSEINQIKNRLKGGIFYQIKIKCIFDNNFNTYFNNQMNSFNIIKDLFNNNLIQENKKQNIIPFSPKIIICHTNIGIITPIRYDTFCKKIKNIDIISYNQVIINLISILIYKQINNNNLVG